MPVVEHLGRIIFGPYSNRNDSRQAGKNHCFNKPPRQQYAPDERIRSKNSELMGSKWEDKSKYKTFEDNTAKPSLEERHQTEALKTSVQ
jgi:hypothetical protein